MSRTEKHRHVRTVLAAIDRAMASPHDEDAGLTRCAASMIIELGGCSERFLAWKGQEQWTSPALRAVVLAFALHAPADELADMAREARKQIKWVDWWDTDGHIEVRLTPSEIDARRRRKAAAAKGAKTKAQRRA
ncbi:MAG: hypothetical protein SFX73_38585 [Kofleriaceae bacterium]|nr:hypothetical protein [Kofleriaceae bacterium]